ncbi:GNAT family N-acetyltransferase [Nonomuraea sp. NPDC049152]|uniref:GNAT family N-acetyltransferase n=1 Tax=Nonomuraea sp. NPDC049152 TaxID=3154350 RepID=UPI0033CC8639
MIIRPADRKADAVRIGAVLALAFHDDPVVRWMLPSGERTDRMFATLARHVHALGDLAFDGEDLVGATLWDPPGHKQPALDMMRSLPGFVAAMGRRVSYGRLLETTFHKARPSRPHWYLAEIGTDPAAQGRGAGSALLRTRLDRCDADGVAAYLESSKETNIPFYEKHGFQVTREILLPENGPTVWAMLREPVS